MTRTAVAVALAGVLALGGCAGPTSGPSSGPSPTDSEPPQPETTSASPVVTTPPTPVPALLAWEPALRPVEETVTTGGGWTIVVDQERSLATLDGPRPRTVAGDKRFRVSDVLLDTAYAVVVTSDSLEERPAVATVVDLATGRTSRVDGRSDAPTTSGGTWALHGTRLVHATVDPDGAYCLAERDLAADTAAVSWCAEKRHGFTSAHLTTRGLTVTGFDDQRPSCRTVGVVTDGALEPFPDVAGCAGWEGVVTDGGAVWSVISKENDLEAAVVYARTAIGVVELGPATAGTLTWCGGATYFVRDPQGPGEPARLLRWSDAGSLETVYESKGGQAFLSAPRCGGDRITVSAFAESGDEQVSAPLG
ncbi:MAG: hypothetical protein ABIQ15_01010 [Nocardioides sp.]